MSLKLNLKRADKPQYLECKGQLTVYGHLEKLRYSRDMFQLSNTIKQRTQGIALELTNPAHLAKHYLGLPDTNALELEEIKKRQRVQFEQATALSREMFKQHTQAITVGHADPAQYAKQILGFSFLESEQKRLESEQKRQIERIQQVTASLLPDIETLNRRTMALNGISPALAVGICSPAIKALTNATGYALADKVKQALAPSWIDPLLGATSVLNSNGLVLDSHPYLWDAGRPIGYETIPFSEPRTERQQRYREEKQWRDEAEHREIITPDNQTFLEALENMLTKQLRDPNTNLSELAINILKVFRNLSNLQAAYKPTDNALTQAIKARIYHEIISGASINHPELLGLMEQLYCYYQDLLSYTAISDSAKQSAQQLENKDSDVHTVNNKNQSTIEPWLIKNPNDPPHKLDWYIPARYFARELCKENEKLRGDIEQLTNEIVSKLTDKGIYKRGGKKSLSPETIKKALQKVKYR